MAIPITVSFANACLSLGATGNVSTGTPTAFTDTTNGTFGPGLAAGNASIQKAGPAAAVLHTGITAVPSATALTLTTGASSTATNVLYSIGAGLYMDYSGATTVTVTYNAAIAAGNLLAFQLNLPNGSSISAVSDSLGNKWLPCDQGAGPVTDVAATYTAQMFFTQSVAAAAAGTYQLTLTIPNASAYFSIEFFNISTGQPGNWVIDQYQTGTGTGLALATTNPLTPQYSLGFALCCTGIFSGISATGTGAGWTRTPTGQQDSSATGGSATDFYGDIGQYQTFTTRPSSLTATATQTENGGWLIIATSFGFIPFDVNKFGAEA